LSPEITVSREPTPLVWRKATSKRSSGRALRSRRGRRAGHVHSGVLQEPGRSCRLRHESGMGSPVNNPWLAAVASCGCENEAQGARRYREAKETKQRGRGGRKSECFVLPKKRGNQPEGPRGGKGASEHGRVRGKDGGDIELHNRINET